MTNHAAECFASPANIAYVMSATGCSEREAVDALIIEKGNCEEAILYVRYA